MEKSAQHFQLYKLYDLLPTYTISLQNPLITRHSPEDTPTPIALSSGNPRMMPLFDREMVWIKLRGKELEADQAEQPVTICPNESWMGRSISSKGITTHESLMRLPWGIEILIKKQKVRKYEEEIKTYFDQRTK